MAGPGACQEVSGLLQALADGALFAAERGTVEAHVASCPGCAREVARLRDNAAYLRESLAPFRMPADFSSDFLFSLPAKDGKRRPAPAAPAAPRTVVMGDTRDRGTSPWKWAAGFLFLAAAGGLAWLFFGPEPEPVRKAGPGPLPEPGPRDPKGTGAADPRSPGKGKTEPPKPAPPTPRPPTPGDSMKNAADLLGLIRAVRGDAYESVIRRGWDLLAGNADEARACREIAAKEKEPKVRAALVLCLGADGGDENRTALAGFLSDESPEVRAAAALGLARSLSFDAAQKKRVPSGPPLNAGVDIGPMADVPARSEIASRLGTEPDPAVRRVLFAALGPSAATDPTARDRILDGVKGLYGDDVREAALKSLQGLQDPAILPALVEALGQHGLPRALHAAVIDAIGNGDKAAAGEAFANLLATAEGAELRRDLVAACGRVEGEKAGRAVLQALASDAEPSVRLAAAQALLRFPTREAADAAQRAAENDSDQMVRQEAERVAKALKSIVDKPEGGDAPPPEGGDAK